MLQRFQHQLGQLWDRHCVWVHLLGLILVSYLALAWVLKGNWWGEPFRDGSRGASAAHHFRAQSARYDELHGWRLLGTVTDESNLRWAVVAHEGRRILVQPGERLGDGLEIVSVETGALVVKLNGDLQTLALVADRNQAPAGAARGVRVDLSRRMAGDLFSQLPWAAVPMGGSFVGMRLLAPGGRNAAAFGLLSGDMLESVNGLPVTEEDIRERLHERFRSDESVRLGVRREGRLVYLHYSMYD